MQLDTLSKILKELDKPSFKMKQILKYYFEHPITKFTDIPNIGKELGESLDEKLPINTIELQKLIRSKDTDKYLFKTKEHGYLVEAVVMKHFEGRKTICLSCQSGCPMKCAFCATGTLGFLGNLTAGEIVDMAREIQFELKKEGEEITNIVYMGMGEPFLNYDAVKESITILHDYLSIGWRKISVSTCGIVPKIMEFAHDFPQVNLAISLHASDDTKRSEIMPVNTQFPLKKLLQECISYVKATKRKIFFEYLLIDGFNDTRKDAEELAKLLTHPLFHVNLIRYHENVANRNWKAPSYKKIEEFKEWIEKAGLLCTLRKSYGENIDAACGMLALKSTTQNSTITPRQKKI